MSLNVISQEYIGEVLGLNLSVFGSEAVIWGILDGRRSMLLAKGTEEEIKDLFSQLSKLLDPGEPSLVDFFIENPQRVTVYRETGRMEIITGNQEEGLEGQANEETK